MKKLLRILALVAAPIVLMGIAVVFWVRTGNESELQRYKQELRAKGEKLTWTELGYPRPPQTNSGLELLTNAVNSISSSALVPGVIRVTRYSRPGFARVAEPPIVDEKSGNPLPWADVHFKLAAASNALSEIRLALNHPAPYFTDNPSNLLDPNAARNPYVPKRTAAQWLSIDAFDALKAGEDERALANVHAIFQLAQLHKNEPVLVNQMIRIAIAGLGLEVIWGAVQNDNWSDRQLAAMQSNCESIEPLKALEAGILGERAITSSLADAVRHGYVNNVRADLRVLSPDDTPRNLTWRLLLRMNLDGNELLLLQYHQKCLEVIRALQKGGSWVALGEELKRAHEKIEARGEGLNRYRYLVALILSVNMEKAGRTTIRNETRRQLTVTAIGLKRFQLRHGKLPSDLSGLVPEYLSAIPIDPMNGEPLHYRPNSDGSFALWSVGEDGADNHGDPNPPSPVKELDIWSGRDAVWPLPDKGN